MRFVFLLFFLASAALAIAATPVYVSAGMMVFENPSDPTNSLAYFALIVLFTAFILLAAKFRRFLAALIYFLTFISIAYVLSPFAGIIGFATAAAVVAILIARPHWAVIDAAALLLSAGIAAMFGISLEPLPAVLLLAILAAYDFVAVYRTGHMVKLAESVENVKAPMLFIVPAGDKKAYMGVGDVVMPNILAVSAQRFTNSVAVFGVRISALATILGATLGLAALLCVIERRGGAHPGLPFVNGGAIAGFVASLLMTRA